MSERPRLRVHKTELKSKMVLKDQYLDLDRYGQVFNRNWELRAIVVLTIRNVGGCGEYWEDHNLHPYLRNPGVLDVMRPWRAA